jgi:hypothetical protein
MRNKVRQHTSGALVAIAAVMIGGMLTEDGPVVYYTRDYSKLDVVAGETVKVDAYVFRDRSCSSRVRREWIDADGNMVMATISPVSEILKKGEERYETSVVIPINAAPGSLRQRVSVTFYCNFVQRLLNIGSNFALPDVVFNVTKPATP